MNSSEFVTIGYTNHHGETADRRIQPHEIEFRSTQWHPQQQWILHAYDLDKNAMRSFAMNQIHSWTGVK